MGALDGVYAKLDRARVHAREMKQRLDAGLDPELHEFVREYDGSPSKYVYKIERLPAVDPKWSLVLGDFLTNMRAALDHLAWQLVVLDGGTPSKATQFPILKSDIGAKGQHSPARLRPAVSRQDILDAVESVQPYAVARQFGFTDATNNGLFILNELVNVDKHRLLIEVMPVLNTRNMYWTGDPSPEVRILHAAPLKEGEPVAWFDFGDAEADPNFDPHLGLEIRVYGGPSIAAIRVPDLFGLISRIYGEIEFGIGTHFAPLFGLSPRHWANILAEGPP